MISALFYLQLHSVKNRLTRQVKRLKQPKYLGFAIIGGLYFYWYVFGILLRGGNTGARKAIPAMPVDPVFYESLGALVLLGIIFLAWVIPHQRAALVFTEAEVAFLFPAPVSRRGLIHYKLLRSQLSLLFTVIFFTLIFNRFGGSGRGLIRAGGWWVILLTLNLHFLASSFALTRLMDSGISNLKRRLGVVAVALVVLGCAAWWTVREIPQLTSANLENPNAFVDYCKQAMVSGPLPYLLYPFRLVVRPYLAPDWAGFLTALGPALLLMVLHYIWVIRADVAFEEASVVASQKLAETITAMRAGKMGARAKRLKPKRPPFQLSASGSPLMGLFWKNLIGAGSAFTARLWIILAIGLFAVSSMALGTAHSSAWPPVVAFIAAMLGVWVTLLGPHIVRQDFRQDLPQADLLKLYPLRGWQIALGEILAPVAILTAVQWLFLIVAVVCGAGFGGGEISPALVLAIGAGAAVLLPALNVVSLIIPNSAVLCFPAWFQGGKNAPQGIEATGQRLVFAIGQFLALGLALVPAGGVFAGIFLLLKYLAGPVVAVPVASAAAALVLLIEGGLGVMLLGWLFERFDLSAEPTT